MFSQLTIMFLQWVETLSSWQFLAFPHESHGFWPWSASPEANDIPMVGRKSIFSWWNPISVLFFLQISLVFFGSVQKYTKITSAQISFRCMPGLWGLSLVGHPAMHARTLEGPHLWRPQRRVRLQESRQGTRCGGWTSRNLWLENPQFWGKSSTNGKSCQWPCLRTRGYMDMIGYGC